MELYWQEANNQASSEKNPPTATSPKTDPI